jgi:restriction system protein
MERPMWMARGDSGRLYEEFKRRSVVAIGWWELIDSKPGITRKELAAIYETKRPGSVSGLAVLERGEGR